MGPCVPPIAGSQALPLETAQLPAGPGGSSSQSPAVTASGPDIEVAAPDGTVKLVSNVCGMWVGSMNEGCRDISPCVSRCNWGGGRKFFPLTFFALRHGTRAACV